MPFRRPNSFNHVAVVTRARTLIKHSKGLLEQASTSTFLGVRHYDPFPLAERSKRVPSLKVIDGDQGRTERVDYSVAMEWQTIRTAPFGRDLQLAVIKAGGVYALIFPCRRVLRGWVKAETNEYVYVRPTHWREWKDCNSVLFPLATSLEKDG
ncbi:hypothetical protein [Bradyrhizobium sp.]|uniref:hypothetical protein n=1 Tax=Bradyrhizobium sp. TaxID=376 RepID=UPI002626BE92|nr:hypothetical protein [Bradyrhizobium sp.]